MMLRRFSPSPAMAVALVALFVALAGGAYAAARNSIGTAQLRNRAVTHAKLARNSVFHANLGGGVVRNNNLARNSVFHANLGGGVVRRNNLQPALIAELRGAAGPPGPQGPAGPAGPAGSAIRSYATGNNFTGGLNVATSPSSTEYQTTTLHLPGGHVFQILEFASITLANFNTFPVLVQCRFNNGRYYPTSVVGGSPGYSQIFMLAHAVNAGRVNSITLHCTKASSAGRVEAVQRNVAIIATP